MEVIDIQIDFHLFCGKLYRWNTLEKACLKFTVLYGRIEDNPASSTSPDDWISSAKDLYYNHEGKKFAFEQPWNLLKLVPKFRNLA